MEQALVAAILVVDDQMSYTEAIGRYLEGKGFRTVTRNRVADVFQGDEGPYRAAIIDLCIEGDCDGLELIRCLRKRFPLLPVIVITGLREKTALQEARDLDVEQVMVKPFAMDALEQAVEAAVLLRETHLA